MKSSLILAAALILGLGATTARAQESKKGPEFFHQTPGGQSELSIHGGYRMSTTRATGAGATDTKLTGLDRLGVGYEYGLNDMMSLGADLSWSSFKTDTTPEVKSEGIEPVLLMFQGKYPIGFGFLEYGVNGTFALEQAKVTATSTNRTLGDVLTGQPRGGFHLAPYVGVSGAAGPGTVGAAIGSELVSTDTKVDVSGSELTYKGGNRTNISAFYEYMLSDMPLGASLSWITQSDIKSTNAAGVESTVSKALSLTGLGLYTRIPQGDSAWVPSLNYYMKAGSDSYDKLDDLHLNIAYRMGL